MALADEAKGGGGAKSVFPASGTETGTGNSQLLAIGAKEQWRKPGPEDIVAGVQPQMVFEPQNEVELASVLRCADSSGLVVIPRGNGTKSNWGNPPKQADLILSTRRLNRIIEHAWEDLTVSVEAGCTFETLQKTLAEHGQRVAVDPLCPEHATIGGILSTNDSGTLRIRFGALRDLIIGVTIALPDGTLASSGGKVVKNVAGYDLPKLMTGALGTLGVITRAVFRLHPLPHNERSFTFVTRDLAEANRLILAVHDSKLAHTGMQVRFASETQPEVDIRFDGTEAGLAAQSETLRKLSGSAIEKTGTGADVWHARQHLFGPVSGRVNQTSQTNRPAAIAKLSVLPGSIAGAFDSLRDLSAPLNVRWQAVVQGTGLGWVRLEASKARSVHQLLETLRSQLESADSSLVVLYRSPEIPRIDTWGNPGDAFPLMKSVKQQFDPHNTLNPGRFVGGI